MDDYKNTEKQVLMAFVLLGLSCIVIVVWSVGRFIWCLGGGCPISETRTDITSA